VIRTKRLKNHLLASQHPLAQTLLTEMPANALPLTLSDQIYRIHESEKLTSQPGAFCNAGRFWIVFISRAKDGGRDIFAR